jgi:hypothetical protein
LCEFLITGDESIFNLYDRNKLKDLNYTGVGEVDNALNEYANKVKLLLEKWIFYEANNDGNIKSKLEPQLKLLANIANNPAFIEYYRGYRKALIHNPQKHKRVLLKEIMEHYPNNIKELITFVPHG